MQNVDVIIRTRGQLVTCASGGVPKKGMAMRDVGVIQQGAVAVDGKKIVAIGNTDEILSKYSAAQLIDAHSRVICPGFVDPHTHIVYGGNRLDEFEQKIAGADYLEILKNGGGILSTVQQTRGASVESLVESARGRLDKMLACGTTTAEIKTGYGLNTEAELKMLRVFERLDQSHPITLVPTFLAAHAVPAEHRSDPTAYVDMICSQMLGEAWQWYEASHFYKAAIPFFTDVFCENNAFDLAQARRILNTAKSLGFGIKAHVDEFTNLGGSEMAIELEAASIDHLDQISDGEVKLLASSETVGVITPTVNFNLGSPVFADARKLIDSGCAVAVSTDYNPGSAPCPSQPTAMAIACRYQKLSPAEALNAVTINSAFAIGLGDRFGSIEVGKIADILILNTDDYRDIAYEFGGPKVDTVIIAGKQLSVESAPVAQTV